MATYYVRTDGSDTNAGTGPAANQAWQTVQKALGATGIGVGDTLYIAPGVYRESVTAAFTNPTSEGQRITISGDPTASQFSGITAGPVIITNYTSSTGTNGALTLSISKSFVTIQNLHITGYLSGNSNVFLLSGESVILTSCGFYTPTNNVDFSFSFRFLPLQGTAGLTVSKCIFFSPVTIGAGGYTAAFNSGTTFTDCIFMNPSVYVPTACVLLYSPAGAHLGGVTIQNCRFIGNTGIAPYPGNNMSTAFPIVVRNCIFETSTGITSTTNNGQITQSYNVFNCGTTLTNVAAGTGSLTRPFISPDYNLSRITGWGNFPFWANHSSSASQNAGTLTGAPAADIYGVTWLAPSTPTIGAIEYFDNSSTGRYVPTERNASTITIAPGSTSQSIELYLGATGLTASTSGLSARYNRTRTASVSIPLVARTIAQAWTSGGFAEVDATNMPGVYRLDLPDAALAAGADDVTIVVRGASGTNGAVMTIKLSSGGLTSAQTASAVWDAATASYTNNGSFGLNVLRADQQNKAGNVTLHSSGNVNRVDADVHAIANDTDAATELKGALLHNGTDYISADLLTPVSAATSVHIGPYQLLADGLGADQPLDVNVGTATSIDVQVTDANGTGIDITGATVSAKVYNSGGTLVATYAGTATYADNGRLSFGLTTTVTNTSGTYTVTVTRTTGASDTQVFGPLKLYVRPV